MPQMLSKEPDLPVGYSAERAVPPRGGAGGRYLYEQGVRPTQAQLAAKWKHVQSFPPLKEIATADSLSAISMSPLAARRPSGR